MPTLLVFAVVAAIFHAYPIEWVQLTIAAVAVLVHMYGYADAVRTYFDVKAHYPNRADLHKLALGESETAMWRMLQQVALVVVGVVGVLMAPPPISGFVTHSLNIIIQVRVLRACLMFNSGVSIVKEIRAIMNRHEVIRLWKISKVTI